jgi:hypothetical protein
MRIREYTPADLDAVRRLHATQGFGYPLPDLDSPLLVTKLVLEDEVEENASIGAGTSGAGFSLWGLDRTQFDQRAEIGGREAAAVGREESRRDRPARGNSPRIVMAALLRLTAEAYLLHDPSAGRPRERWQRLLALHEAARQHAATRGLDDVQAFLPPRVARAFGRRLARLGWRPDPWPCFSRMTGQQ